MGADGGRLNGIRRLYEGYYNTNQDAEVFAKEFYYAVGEILSGKELQDLKLHFVLLEEIL